MPEGKDATVEGMARARGAERAILSTKCGRTPARRSTLRWEHCATRSRNSIARLDRATTPRPTGCRCIQSDGTPGKFRWGQQGRANQQTKQQSANYGASLTGSALAAARQRATTARARRLAADSVMASSPSREMRAGERRRENAANGKSLERKTGPEQTPMPEGNAPENAYRQPHRRATNDDSP